MSRTQRLECTCVKFCVNSCKTRKFTFYIVNFDVKLEQRIFSVPTVGRACSSDVSSVLRTKAEKYFFWRHSECCVPLGLDFKATDDYIVHYRIAGNFRGVQFSRKGNLQRFRSLIFADGRSRTAPPTIPG